MTRQAFLKKLENYWYYYKIHTIAGVLAVAFIIYCLTLIIKPYSDIKMIYISGKQQIGYAQQDKLKELFKPYVPDQNKDGKKDIALQQIILPLNLDDTTTRERVLSQIRQSGAAVLIADSSGLSRLKSIISAENPVDLGSRAEFKGAGFSDCYIVVCANDGEASAAAEAFVNNLKK